MNQTTLIVGGCRSGKSRHALEIAEKRKTPNKLFIATCIPHDDEMKQRVARHQEERGDDWQTLETPLELPEAIRQHGPKSDLILVDCLTLWVNNLLLETSDPDAVEKAVQNLQNVLKTARCPVILVSNEVGAGIVPENALARQFRDIMGQTNQQIAACVDRVIWMAAGIPVTVKSAPKNDDGRDAASHTPNNNP